MNLTTFISFGGIIKDMRKKMSMSFPELMGCVFMGVFLGILLNLNGDVIYETLLEIGIFCVLLYFCLFVIISLLLATLVHEIGHVVCGILSGYKFISFRAFNVMLLNKDGKITFTKDSIPGTSGDCRMAPPDLVDGKMPVFWYLLGGSLFNFIFALVAIIPFVLHVQAPVFLLFCGVFIFVNIVCLLANVTPKVLYMPNDGHNLKELLKNKKNIRILWINMKILEQVHKGVRLSDMPDEWFSLSDDDIGVDAVASNYRAIVCERLCLMRAYNDAIPLIERALYGEYKLTGVAQTSLAASHFYISVLQGDFDKAKEVFERYVAQYDKMLKNEIVYSRIKYAYKLITKPTCTCVEKQKKHFLDMIDKMDNSVYSFMMPDELAFFEEMEAAIKEAQATQNT